MYKKTFSLKLSVTARHSLHHRTNTEKK